MNDFNSLIMELRSIGDNMEDEIYEKQQKINCLMDFFYDIETELEKVEEALDNDKPYADTAILFHHKIKKIFDEYSMDERITQSY